MHIPAYDRTKKALAFFAILALIGTSVPAGALTAFAEEDAAIVSEDAPSEESGGDEVQDVPASEESIEEDTTTDADTDVVEDSETVDEEPTPITPTEEGEGGVETESTSGSGSGESTPVAEENDEATIGFVTDAEGVETIESVVLGVTYVAPQNDQVQVTFTSLPEGSGSLSIREVELTPEQVVELGALSSIAYDITSSMQNGTFSYDLTLPLPEGVVGDTQVVFAEDEAALDAGAVETVAVEQVEAGEQTVAVSELNHFTIFVVTSFEEEQVTPPATGYNGIWTAFGLGATITQVPTGTDGIDSSEGENHAVIRTSAYTEWDGYRSEFPEGGYDTRIDVYLDMSLATGHLLTKRMAFSSAVNDTEGDYRRDFVFHLGTRALSPGRWQVSASNNLVDLPGNPFNRPITLNTSGWYTLEHQFRDVGGVLTVTMNIYKKGVAAPVGSWTRSHASDVIGDTVGGNRYGWFVDTGVLNRFSKIAIDSAKIKYATPSGVPVRPALDGEFIYDAIPSVLPSNLPSQGYQATQTFELGDKITFEPGTGRHLLDGAVTLSSWACESGQWNLGTCETTPGATFTHPITLNLYTVAEDGSVGYLIASRTQTFEIPYRPSANATCADPKQWKDTSGDCFNGLNHVIVFDLDGITVPDTVIYGIAYNTRSYGSEPIGVDGPYNSLNVSLNTDESAPYIGTDVDTDEIFSDYASEGGFSAEGEWSPYKVAVAFSAQPLTPITMCKFVDEDPEEGWGMTLSNMNEVPTVYNVETDETGCVTVLVDFASGPWRVVEEERDDYTQELVEVSEGLVVSIDESDTEACEFGTLKPTFAESESSEDFESFDSQEDGYICTFFNAEDKSNQGTRLSNRVRPQGQVLGASTTNFCVEPYLTENLGLGRENDAAQVIRLQSFLNEHLSAGLTVNGLFEETTEQAVMDFQRRYASDVLTPWGISEPTGFVYHTTKKKINELVCQRAFPLTTAQLDEIARIKNAIAAGVTSEGAPEEMVAGAAATAAQPTVPADTSVPPTEDTTENAEEEESQGFFGRIFDSIFGN
jgi:hypothetical protein